MTTIRIKAADGEFFVSATKPGRQSLTHDSVWYSQEKALERIGKLLAGATIGDETGERLTARLRELEAQRDELNRLCGFNEMTMEELLTQNTELLAALTAYVVADNEIFGDMIGGEIRDKARAAIHLAKGGAI